MKKTLIALAVLGLSSTAFAASDITLYGVLDGGFQLSKTKGSDSTFSFDSGNYYGSRWGIQGVEDLGNGNQVGFQLEQGFSLDSGAASNSARQFHRVSRLYVNGSWGQVGFGRVGALASGTGPYDILHTWALGTSFGSTNAWDGIAGNAGRLNNSIVYVSPNLGGLKLTAMYSNGTDTDDAKAEWSKNNHYYGIGAVYANGGLKASLVLDARDRKGIADADVASAVDTTNLDDITNNVDNPIYGVNFGVSYDLGSITPQFGYAFTTQEDVAKQHVIGLSATTPVAGGKAMFGTMYVLGSLDGATKNLAGAEDKYRLLTINAMYDYPVSKRTTVYGYAGWTDGSKLYKKTGNVSNLFSGSTVNTNGYAVQVGLMHKF